MNAAPIPVGQVGRPDPVRAAYAAAAAASLVLLLGAWMGWLVVPLDTTELFAFVTGLWTVWLAARNNVWSWPIGVVNSGVFVAVFYGARLYFDMSLNVFYVGSGLWGWWSWAFGGRGRTEKPIERVGRREALLLALACTLLALAMWRGGILLDDAAPFLDALTTALSIAAQWLLMRRFVETWYLWIAADLVYVPLYLSRGLPLTAWLYAIFLVLCLRGLAEWRVRLRRQAEET